MVFPVFFTVFDHQHHCKTKKTHEFWILNNSLTMFFDWFLQWFWCFFMVLGVFLGFLQWFRALDHQNRCKH